LRCGQPARESHDAPVTLSSYANPTIHGDYPRGKTDTKVGAPMLTAKFRFSPHFLQKRAT